MPVSLDACLLCSAQQTLAHMCIRWVRLQPLFWLHWNLFREAQAVLFPSPFDLHPSKVLPTCRTSSCPAESVPRRRRLPLGDSSSSGTCFWSHIIPVWWAKHSLMTSASHFNTLLEQWTVPFFLSDSLFLPFSSLAFTFFLFPLVFPFLLPFGGVCLRER